MAIPPVSTSNSLLTTLLARMGCSAVDLCTLDFQVSFADPTALQHGLLAAISFQGEVKTHISLHTGKLQVPWDLSLLASWLFFFIAGFMIHWSWSNQFPAINSRKGEKKVCHVDNMMSEGTNDPERRVSQSCCKRYGSSCSQHGTARNSGQREMR